MTWSCLHNIENYMRQKLQIFHKEIRRNQLETYFQQKRDYLLNVHSQETVIQNNPQGPPPRQEHPHAIQTEEESSSEAQIYQQWKQEEQMLEQSLSNGNYAAIIPITCSVQNALKKVSSKHSMLNWKRSEIYHVFLRGSMLSNIVKSVVSADRDGCSNGLIQELSRAAIGVLKYAVNFEPLEFGQDLFLQSDLLPFLRICISCPALDHHHLSRMMAIMTHMIVVSSASEGKLFSVLNEMGNSVFNFSAPFYAISKLQIQPTDDLTINFLIMIKHYLLEIERSAFQAKQKQREGTQITLNLSSDHLDICFEVANRSVDYYMRSSFMQEQDMSYSFEECLQVLRLLIEQLRKENKWLFRVDWKGLVNLLRLRECPTQIIQKILIILDHVIFIDTKYDLTFELVKQCELISVIWQLRSEHYGFVMNMIANLACLQQFKPDIDPIVHQIFLTIGYTSNKYMLYQFTYNWFSSQQFQILTSKDQLMIKILSESTEEDPKTVQLQAFIWIKLIEKNNLIVPRRIVEHQNRACQKLRQMLMETQTDFV